MLKKRLLGMITLLIGVMLSFSFASCNLTSPLNGTWESNNPSSPGVYTFSGSNYEFIYSPNPITNQKGTFSLNKEKTQLTLNQTHSGDPWQPDTRGNQSPLSISISSNSFSIGYTTYTKK